MPEQTRVGQSILLSQIVGSDDEIQCHDPSLLGGAGAGFTGDDVDLLDGKASIDTSAHSSGIGCVQIGLRSDRFIKAWTKKQLIPNNCVQERSVSES